MNELISWYTMEFNLVSTFLHFKQCVFNIFKIWISNKLHCKSHDQAWICTMRFRILCKNHCKPLILHHSGNELCCLIVKILSNLTKIWEIITSRIQHIKCCDPVVQAVWAMGFLRRTTNVVRNGGCAHSRYTPEIISIFLKSINESMNESIN